MGPNCRSHILILPPHFNLASYEMQEIMSEWKKWSCPLMAAIRGRSGLLPHQGISVGMSLVLGVVGEQAPEHDIGRASDLTSSDTSQAEIQDFKWAYHNIYTIYELLECMKGPILQMQNYRLRATTRQPRGVPVRFQY